MFTVQMSDWFLFNSHQQSKQMWFSTVTTILLMGSILGRYRVVWFVAGFVVPLTVPLFISMLPLLLCPSGGDAWLPAASCWLCVAAWYVVVFVIYVSVPDIVHRRLIVHGAVAVWIIVKHEVIVGHGVCNDAHEEGHKGGVVNKGK